MNRRNFLHSTIALAAISKTMVAANDKVSVAIIGVRGQGRGLARQFAGLPDVDIPYLCDVDQNVFEPAAKAVEEKKGKRPWSTSADGTPRRDASSGTGFTIKNTS